MATVFTEDEYRQIANVTSNSVAAKIQALSSAGGGGSQSLAQTLAIGADANSIGITGLTDLTGDVGSIVSLYSDTLTLIGLTSDLGTQSPDSRVCGDSVIIGDSLALAAFSSIIVVDSLTGVININPSNELDITIGAGLVSKFDATGLYVDTITELTPTEGVLISGAGIKTDIGTLAATGIWKLGNIVTASSVLDGTKYLEVGVDGNRFKLALIV